jgi:sterol O-acyltransferase
MLPSMLFLILGFFGFLHSWLNCWAELTRFPDRVFYLDWWNSVEFGTYYRKWNIIVHDWLYYYIYLDFSRFIMSGKKSGKYAKILTFFISAIMHELILIEASGFFYPVLFVMFTGPGNT